MKTEPATPPDAIVSGLAPASWHPVPGRPDLHLIEADGGAPVAWEGLRLPGLVRFLALEQIGRAHV